MAFTTFLMIVSMVAIASGLNFGHFFLAGFPGWPDNDNPFPGFPSPMMRFGPLASPLSMPRMPTFPQNFPFFQFHDFPPVMPTFPTMPSAADIASAVPPNGGSFTGVVISSKSAMERNKDGSMVNKSGTTVLTNLNGTIHVEKIGNSPPELQTIPPPEENST